MSEVERLEARADVLMRHVEANSKKIRQAKLKNGEWDIRRIVATLKIMQELIDLSQMINEFWKHPGLAT